MSPRSEKYAHPVLQRADERLGDGLDRVVRAHHRRRLERLGWADALDSDADPSPDGNGPGGFDLDAGAHPVRAGNAVTVHVDGAAALSAVQEAVAGAQSSVHVAGWFASPSFRLGRDDGSPTLNELLAQAARRASVRVLLWAGPPLPVFKPTRRMVRAARAQFESADNVQCALDRRERTMHCHHEKIVVVDGRVAFVGGIDLTALAGDRWDSPAHVPDRPLGWHDAACELRGPVVGDVAAHFAARWSEVTGEPLEPLAAPEPAGESAVRFVRTVPERAYRFAPRGDFSILAAYLRALRAARSFVYLENQFLWSTEVIDVLADKLRRPPTDEFRVLLVLPTRPNNGADTTRGQLGRLLEADEGRGRLLATTVDAHAGGRTGPLYVHAKVGVVDDAWLTVGSANLNEHSLFNDTEANVVVHDPALARQTRLRLWSEHLERPVAEVSGDPVRVFDELWRPTAAEQSRRARRGEKRSHRLTLLPDLSRHAERLQGPLRGLLVDG